MLQLIPFTLPELEAVPPFRPPGPPVARQAERTLLYLKARGIYVRDWIILYVRINVSLTCRKAERVLRRPSAGDRVIIPRAEARQPSMTIEEPARITKRLESGSCILAN